MTQDKVEEKTKKKGRAKGIPLTSTLPPDERLRVFVNFIIDRIKDEQVKGVLPNLIKNLEVKNA